MTTAARATARTALVTLLAVSWLLGRVAHASSSGDELVRQARTHEAEHEDDLAVRRYMEALTIEPTNGDAWMGLGALRSRLGDTAEADRVYSLALDRVPSLHQALEGRAHARWALGRHADAEVDLDVYAALEESTAALRELAGWYGSDGRTPVQLAIWRRLLATALRREDAAGASEARRMVRALVILVDGADPASSPPGPDATRRAMATIARRGG